MARPNRRAGLRSRRARASRASRALAERVLAQGVGAAPAVAFGNRRQRARKKVNGRSRLRKMLLALDAKVPITPGLPRAVGPYTTIRTSSLIATSSKFVLFSPFMGTNTGNLDFWWSVCGVEAVDTSLPINNASNTKWLNASMPGGDPNLTCVSAVPAAMTVQVMNPTAISTTSGIVAGGRVKQQLHLANDPRTWDKLGTEIMAYMQPRLMSAGKLALRGVQCSAYPLDMTEYSDFRQLGSAGTLPFTWVGQDTAPGALTPIVFWQPESGPTLQLEYLVTIEWRVRFDLSNPASASHVHHDTWADADWNHVCAACSDAGHGVVDIVESIANAGAAVAEAPAAVVGEIL